MKNSTMTSEAFDLLDSTVSVIRDAIYELAEKIAETSGHIDDNKETILISCKDIKAAAREVLRGVESFYLGEHK